MLPRVRSASNSGMFEGLFVITWIRPPTELRPYSVPWGPRRNSMRSTLSRGRLVLLIESWGTPSMYVVTAGSPWPDPMPRMNGKLSRRAVNSVTFRLGT